MLSHGCKRGRLEQWSDMFLLVEHPHPEGPCRTATGEKRMIQRYRNSLRETSWNIKRVPEGRAMSSGGVLRTFGQHSKRR